MGVDNPAHIIHTAIANFDIVPVEYLLENVLFREMFVNQMKELYAYVGCHMLAERWIEPNDIAIALAGGFVGIAVFGVLVELERVVIPGVFECLLVW